MRVENYYYQHHKKGPAQSVGLSIGLGVSHTSLTLPKAQEYQTRPVSNISCGGSVSFGGIPKIAQSTGKFIANTAVSVFSSAARKVQYLSLDKDGKQAFKAAYQAVKDARPAKEWAKSLSKSEGFERFLNFVSKNSGVFDAFNALVLAGMIKPVLVMAMPGAEDEDKEQIATKNFVAAMIGFVLSVTILGALSKGSERVVKNAREHFKKNPDIAYKLKNDPKYKETYGDFWQKGMEVVIAPTKAAITIGLMPYVTKALFGKKNEEKEHQKLLKEYQYILPAGINRPNKDIELFRKTIEAPLVKTDNDKHDDDDDHKEDDD